MKKSALILIGVLLITTAQAASVCDQYTQLAEQKVTPPYPEYFGAGEEYLHAAKCYQQRGMRNKALDSYSKAAQRYLEASEALVEDGDYHQAALSYKKAGISYEYMGETEKAIESYKNSIKDYEKGGYSAEAEEVRNKIDSLKEQERKSNPLNKADSRSLIGLVSLVGLFVSLAFLIITVIANTLSPKDEGRPMEDSMEGYEKPDIKSVEDSESKDLEQEKKESGDKPPEERVIEKLRKKYKP